MNKSKLSAFGPYLILIAAMLWATDAPFRVHLTKDLPSLFIVLAEHFVDVLVVLPLLFLNWKQFKGLSLKQWSAIGVIAIGGSALASIAFTESFKYVNPSVAILLQKLQPLIAIGLASSLLKEQLRSKFWLWAVVALVGAYIISFPQIVPRMFEGEVFSASTIGIIYALVAALLWGASTVMGKYMLNHVSFTAMTSIRFVLAFIALLVLNIYHNTIPHLSTVTGKDWFYIAIIAVTSGVVSLFIYYRGLQFTKASIATLAELGFPLAAVLVNYWFLDAKLSPMQLGGMIVLIFAIFKLSGVNQREAVPGIAETVVVRN